MRFYYWKLKGKNNFWMAYSVAHNKREIAIVEESMRKYKDKFDFKFEEGEKLK